MIDLNRRGPATARGLWCNLCGSRLVSLDMLRPAPRWARKAEVAGSRSSGEHTWCICEQCYRKRLRCSTCGAQVGAKAFILHGDSRFYCNECFEKHPHCDTCDRPIADYYPSRAQGRNLCDRCQSTAITDPNAAHALYGRVRAALSRQIGLSLHEPCQLKLVSHRQLMSVVDKSLLYSLDADSKGRCFGLFMRQGAQRSIFIESGLPQIVLLE